MSEQKRVSNQRIVGADEQLIFYRWSRLVDLGGRTREYQQQVAISFDFYEHERGHVARKLREARRQLQYAIAAAAKGPAA